MCQLEAIIEQTWIIARNSEATNQNKLAFANSGRHASFDASRVRGKVRKLSFSRDVSLLPFLWAPDFFFKAEVGNTTALQGLPKPKAFIPAQEDLLLLVSASQKRSSQAINEYRRRRRRGRRSVGEKGGRESPDGKAER